MARRKEDTKSRKCKLCGRVFVGKGRLIDHIGNVHKDSIPEGWSPSRFENYLRTGKTEGHCVQCGTPTDWNESTWKYHRLCKSPACRKAISDNADKNMIGAYGKKHLLNDPNMQRKMVYAKRTSKTYYFEDPDDPSIKYPAHFDSSYGMDFAEMIDVFLNFNGRDIIAPSPHVYYYKYEGKDHFYIPDAYIVSINTELEFKDGGDNPNRHPKIQAVDKEKERLKDEVMYSIRDQVNYVKIVNKDYTGFFTLLAKLKAEDIVYMPKWQPVNKKAIVQESYEGESPFDLIPDFVTNTADSLAHTTSKLGKKLYSNPVTYSEVIYDLKKDIDNIKTERDWQRMETALDNIREYLSSISNGESDSAKQLKYEADKAIRIIDTRLKPLMEIKREKFRKKEPKKSMESFGAVEEATVPADELLDPTKWSPIYILLTRTGTAMSNVIAMYTKDNYTHSSFSFDESMTDMYSFTAVGFEHENIHTHTFKKYENTTKYSVYAMMIPTQIKNEIRAILELMYANAKEFKYSVVGVLKFALNLGEDKRENAKFCSQFVADVMKMIDSNIIRKPSFKVKPQDFTHNKRLFHIQHGTALKNYKPEKAKQTLIEKIKRGDYEL